MNIRNIPKIKLVGGQSRNDELISHSPYRAQDELMELQESARRINRGIVAWKDLQKFEPLREQQLRNLFPKLQKHYRQLKSLTSQDGEISRYQGIIDMPNDEMLVVNIVPHLRDEQKSKLNFIQNPFYTVQLTSRQHVKASAYIIQGKSWIQKGNNNNEIFGFSYYIQPSSRNVQEHPYYLNLLGRYLASLNFMDFSEGGN